MPSVWNRLEPHLLSVQNPAQYIGGEWNLIRRDWDLCPTRFLMAFPDAYTIGMSHLGLQIIYSMLNRMDGVLCERAFTPWPDLEAVMRREKIPLFSVDTHRPAGEFDLIGFSLQSEMGYSNVLLMLDLAGVPLMAADRDESDPIVLGGGPNASFPEPVADFFDLFLIGDGEESLVALVELYRRLKAEGASRETILLEAARSIPGAYAPRFYRVEYEGDVLTSFTPTRDVPERVTKATVADFAGAAYPLDPLVPHAGVVFDRVNLEIMRGCPHRCRFCHAVNFKNKLRFRPANELVEWAEQIYAATGHDEISLISLSSGDHPEIKELMTCLTDRFRDRRVSIALPSLRVDGKLKDLPPLMKSGRRGGFTIAPEGGTEAYRKIIRKPILDEDLFATAESAFREGFTHIKLYFMIGLPHETEADIEGIVATAKQCARLGREIRGRRTEVNVTISPFVPKPHTPFQFSPFGTFETFDGSSERIRSLTRGTPVRIRAHDPRSSYIQAAFARGDRRLSRVLLEAYRLGARFDEWNEHFSLPRWMEAFEKAGLDPDLFARRTFGENDLTPWDHIEVGTPKGYLWKDFRYCDESADRRETVPARAP